MTIILKLISLEQYILCNVLNLNCNRERQTISKVSRSELVRTYVVFSGELRYKGQWVSSGSHYEGY